MPVPKKTTPPKRIPIHKTSSKRPARPSKGVHRKTCFVIMPFGRKDDVDNTQIDFDEVYEFLIKEVAKKCGYQPVRCDEISKSGVIHRQMIEHILASDLAIVDLSTLNANVLYELGVRHALCPTGTILIRKQSTKIPFNLQMLRIVDYDLGLSAIAAAKRRLEATIRATTDAGEVDSSVHDLVEGIEITYRGTSR